MPLSKRVRGGDAGGRRRRQGAAARTGSKTDFDDAWPTKPGSTRLLTPAEELAIVERLDHLRRAVDRLIRPLAKNVPEGTRLDHFDQLLRFFQSLERTPAATARAVKPLLDEYVRLKHRLVLANLPWVTKLSQAQRHGPIAEEDLFQEGVCGLLKAIDRFEAARGLRLMTYATWYIREAMQQIRARQSHLVSLSTHDQTLLGQVESLRARFQHEHERAPSAHELERRTRRPARSIRQLQIAAAPVASLERSGQEGTIPVVAADPTDEYDRLEEIQSAVARLLEGLPIRERTVVTRRFGLDGSEPCSLEDLGDDLNVSKERVRQLQRQAIRRMQEQVQGGRFELTSFHLSAG